MIETIHSDIKKLVESGLILQPDKAPAPGTPIIHTCSCSRTYTREEWKKLEYVGPLDKDEEGDQLLEMRHCVCGSTRAADKE